MKWKVGKFEYEGYPLLLRYPSISNVWAYEGRYSKLLCLTHKFAQVGKNGLPTKDYNNTLTDFDHEVINLFQLESTGFVFLVETYGGKRNYWFYVSVKINVQEKISALMMSHPDKSLETAISGDENWRFIKEYPFKIFEG